MSLKFSLKNYKQFNYSPFQRLPLLVQVRFFGVPKNRISKSKARIKRHYRFVHRGFRPVHYSLCPQCQKPIRMHFICMECYRTGKNENKEIIFPWLNKNNPNKNKPLKNSLQSLETAQNLIKNKTAIFFRNRIKELPDVESLTEKQPLRIHDEFGLLGLKRRKKKRLSDTRNERLYGMDERDRNERRKRDGEEREGMEDQMERTKLRIRKDIREHLKKFGDI